LPAIRQSDEGQDVKVVVLFDAAWRKRGRSDDSSSGMETVVGIKTRKAWSFATLRKTQCAGFAMKPRRTNKKLETTTLEKTTTAHLRAWK